MREWNLSFWHSVSLTLLCLPAILTAHGQEVITFRPLGTGARVGGFDRPDGKTIHCPLPGDQHRKNISSRGEGCCTQTSVNHSARWQNIPALIDFHEWVRQKGLPGGGYPERMAQRIPACSKDRGYPTPLFMQVENNDLEILKLACKTGRMPGVTYSFSPTGRYNGGRISHMVSLVGADDDFFTVLDNNYVGEDAFEHMTPQEFLRTYSGGRTGWSVILLDPPPPPAPWN